MRRLPFVVGIALILAGAAVLSFALLGGEDAASPVQQVTGLPAPASEAPAPAAPSVTVAPSAAAPPDATPDGSPVARLLVPSLGIDAPVVSLGVLPGGVMESPHTATDVGWYRFSARPGTDGNAVFSGHVDYVKYGPAVFYRLKELKLGDVINVALEDGTTYAYRVVSSVVYDADDAPVQEIVGPTPMPTITLITCTGVFDRNVLQYDKRLVVRAERSSVALSGP